MVSVILAGGVPLEVVERGAVVVFLPSFGNRALWSLHPNSITCHLLSDIVHSLFREC